MSDDAMGAALHPLHLYGRPDDQGRPALPLPILHAAATDCHGETL